MSHSLLTADGLTHLKILAVSLIAAIIMMLVGISARVSTSQTDARTKASSVATLLENNGIKRVPIVEDGKMVGIVSRANLLQALASMRKPHDVDADDSAIRESLVARLETAPWIHPALINVIVQDGTADLWGIVESQAEKKAVRVAAEITPGVRAVNDHLIIRPMVSGI